MIPTELLQYLVGRPGQGRIAPISFLETVGDTPRSLGDLAGEHDAEKATAYRALTSALDAHLLKRTDDGYVLTGLGATILYQYHRICENYGVSRNDLACLSNSTHRVTLLTRLDERSGRKADLARGENAPSRATVQRTVSEFEGRGWVTRDDGTGLYSGTKSGSSTLTGYNTLERALSHAQEFTVFLAPLDTRVASIPLEGLADAQLLVESSVTNGLATTAVMDIVESMPEEVWTLHSFVMMRLADIYDPVIRSSACVQVLITERALHALPTEGRYSEHVRRGLTSQNVTVRVVPGDVHPPLNFAIHDDDTVLMCPPDTGRYIELDGLPQYGAVIGTDRDLIEWARTLWEEYYEDSVSLGRHVVRSILNRTRSVHRSGQ